VIRIGRPDYTTPNFERGHNSLRFASSRRTPAGTRDLGYAKCVQRDTEIDLERVSPMLMGRLSARDEEELYRRQAERDYSVTPKLGRERSRAQLSDKEIERIRVQLLEWFRS
jgi:hypothetical protein